MATHSIHAVRKGGGQKTYHDEHQYGQDVEDGVAEQRPPAQNDGLMSGDIRSRHTVTTSRTMTVIILSQEPLPHGVSLAS